MKKIDKIFIIHYTKLIERKKHMLSELNSWFPDTDYEFIEEFDQEHLTPEVIKENFDLEVFEKRFNREMLRSEMSCAMKHKEALKLITQQEGEIFFVLEDDVIFKEDPINYTSAMNNLCEKHNIEYDCVFLGEALIRKGDDRDIFGKKPYPSTNGTCTMLYHKRRVGDLFEDLCKTKITQPMDWEFNDRFRDLALEIYWGKAITKHGSVIAPEDSNFSKLKSAIRKKY